jgi:hypothetical protein
MVTGGLEILPGWLRWVIEVINSAADGVLSATDIALNCLQISGVFFGGLLAGSKS